jgi:hypothetical protein
MWCKSWNHWMLKLCNNLKLFPHSYKINWKCRPFRSNGAVCMPLLQSITLLPKTFPPQLYVAKKPICKLHNCLCNHIPQSNCRALHYIIIINTIWALKNHSLLHQVDLSQASVSLDIISPMSLLSKYNTIYYNYPCYSQVFFSTIWAVWMLQFLSLIIKQTLPCQVSYCLLTGSQELTLVTGKIVFWNVIATSLVEGYRCFRGMYCPHLQGQRMPSKIQAASIEIPL